MARIRVGIKTAMRRIADNWRRLLIIGVVGLFLILILIQLFYPTAKLVPFLKIEGVAVGGKERNEAIKTLDEMYQKQKIAVIIKERSEPVDEFTGGKIGLKISNRGRLEQMRYPWYLRIVPTSLFWAHLTMDPGEADYQHSQDMIVKYIKKQFGEDCIVPPVNPTAIASEEEIKVSPGKIGGKCEFDSVKKQFSEIRPTLEEKNKVIIAIKPEPLAITTDELKRVVATIEGNLQSAVKVSVDDDAVELPAVKVRSWLKFRVDESGLVVEIDNDKASEPLSQAIGERLARPAGVTRITTHDFTETARQDGAVGRELDDRATGDSIVEFLLGKKERAQAVGRDLPPRVEYTRTYSATDAGLSALIKNFAADKPGTFGVSLIELSGEKRRAGFDESKKFTTASTYKVFVAYSTLRRVESGEYRWSDQIVGGRDLATCFDDMIVRSDNPCSEELVRKIGYSAIHREVGALGLTGTSFIDKESFKTTAGDLSAFMAMLESGSLPINTESRARFLDALKRNVYRQGIPAGASGAVADKVGFLNGLLHDTAIVYSPAGTYVLTILTDGSSWSAIAELTRQIEELRN